MTYNSGSICIVNKVGKDLCYIIYYKFDHSEHFTNKYMKSKTSFFRNRYGLDLFCFNKKY